jgi:Tol biopolymer transport system component
MGVLRLRTGVLVLSLLAAAPAAAETQYFGRNKVEYADFDFRILATEHFDVYYYSSEERAAQLAAQLAERWYARISRVLRHQFDRRQPLVVYGSQAEFAQTNVVSGLIPDSVGGVTEGARRRIVMPFAPTMAETDRVLGHEIVHAFQYDISRRHGGMTQPLWFIEGMAEYLARGAVDAESALWLRDAVRSRRIPGRQRDAASRLSPYQYGHAFWAYLGQRFGDEVVVKALKPPKKQRRLADRFRHATGVDLETLHTDWRASVMPTGGAREPERPTPVVAGRMQLGPAISPDGSQAVFFSERDRLSLDLFLADLDTGRVLRKLATTTAQAAIESLQPLRSSGAWSPDGQWFVFPAVRHGRATLMKLDMRGSARDDELSFPTLGQILSVAWSPGGDAIAFSALAGGFVDLYSYDFRTRALGQLTDDAFADLQPAWSHDGRTIAFVTERYSSDLAAARFGRPRLALLDLDTRTVRPMEIAGSHAQLNPQWSADGRGLYFVGDAGGIPNVFRVGRHSRELHQITDVSTGVSGVTPTSPALSAAGRADVLAYTVYQAGRPQLAVMHLRPDAAPSGTEGSRVTPTAADVRGNDFARTADADFGGADLQRCPEDGGETLDCPGDEPPAAEGSESLDSAAGLVEQVLADHQTGLPDPATIEHRAYSSKLSLEGIGQPYLSAGGGPFGTVIRGGGSLLFGDMLSERRLGVAAQFSNRMRDSAFAFRFLNQERRWNWGAIGELEPSIGRYRRTATIEHNGAPALLRETDYLHRIQVRAAGLLAYPFSRGLRVEFIGGVRHARYLSDVRSDVFSAETGRVVSSERVESTGGEPTTVAEIGAAIVHDTTVFGPTGPIVGSRYRFEVAPAVGDLTYTRVVADYRRYFMPVRPYTVALRAIHWGRYGPDGHDPRLQSNFLGSTYLVRGHRLDHAMCRPDAARACGDALLGNRMLVGNVEVRVPLWGIRSRQIDYGAFPIDAILFVDGGVIFSGAHRAGISSFGGGVRVNAGGLPFELIALRALDGPLPRWQFDFGFRLGF